MSKRSRNRPESSDETNPDMGEGALLSALDQKEAEMTGKANPPPSEPQAAAPQPQRQPQRQLCPVALRVWVAATPEKEDQLAGFQNFAKRHGLKDMTMPEWRAEYERFLNRPV